MFFKNNHELAAESAVVGYPHPVKGEGVYAYVVLKEAGSLLSKDEKVKLEKELKLIVKTKISGFAVPEKLQVTESDFGTEFIFLNLLAFDFVVLLWTPKDAIRKDHATDFKKGCCWRI